jgi:hypothetical protein
MHVHVATTNGIAKFWLEPIISLADYHKVSPGELKIMARIMEERQDDFKGSWKKHFKG